MARNIMITGTGRYEAAGILQKLFDQKWNDFEGPRFITNDGNAYPF